MRKFVWAGIAVVVSGAAAVYLAADFAAQHPDSWVARCTMTAGYFGSKCNPMAGVAAARVNCPPSGPVSEEGVAAKEGNPGILSELGAGAPPVGAGEVEEPIKVEPQPAFILPFEPGDIAPAVPASEETPEPKFGPGEESEVPTDVAAPAHDEDQHNVPTPMPYVEDDPPACKCPLLRQTDKEMPQSNLFEEDVKKCDTCPKDCCAEGKCPKDCPKDGCTSLKCAKCCCDWFLGLFGGENCGNCHDCKPAATQAPSDGPDKPPLKDKGTMFLKGVQDVPDCQEDPSYSHQYPSCPYTGSPTGICPYPHPITPAPEGGPLDELETNKGAKPGSTSLLRLMPPSYGSLFEPLSRSFRGAGTEAALRAVKNANGENCAVHPEVDTMEARPTDVDKIPGSDQPF